MDDVDDIMNHPMVKAAISEFGPSLHVPAEVLLEYAAGGPTPEARPRIAAHLKDCPECRVILEQAQQVLSDDDPSEGPVAKVQSPAPWPPHVETKLQWVSRVNRSRRPIAEAVARLLVSEDFRDSVTLILSALETWRGPIPVNLHQSPAGRLVAAFASEVGSVEHEGIERVLKAVEFTRLVCDSVSERCGDPQELEESLWECMAEALEELKHFEPSTDLRHKLMVIFVQNLISHDRP